MHVSYLSAALAVVGSVSALPSPLLDQLLDTVTDTVDTVTVPITKLIPALPVSLFAETKNFTQPVLPEVAKKIFEEKKNKAPETPIIGDLIGDLAGRSVEKRAQCSNPRVRVEWESYPDSSRRAYINAIKCLQSRPASGQFGASRSRYEDIVALHQTLTPNVHGSAKFLLWHRYYTWVFEDVLRAECGFNQPIPWFDETRYAGRFSQSSIFSGNFYGAIGLGGRCVTNGQFANLAINIGPGTGNTQHCLSRDGDSEKTKYCNSDYVNQCNAYGDFAGMASCAESGPHAWGHNGIGAVMQDTYGSPADPVFFLHHAFIDRNFRIWQNSDSSRTRTINGRDKQGNLLTLDTNINVYGIRPDVKVRDILDTQGTTLCYKYNY